MVNNDGALHLGSERNASSKDLFPKLEAPRHDEVLPVPRTVVTAPDSSEQESFEVPQPDATAKEQHSHTFAGYNDDDVLQPPSTWSENSNVPNRHLGFMQILSLIVNSVVGTGIFTQPGYVLFLTKSKPIALALWAAGGVYTAVILLIFLEYGMALPFNGGPMVYLDECFPRPRLLVLIIFSFHRILLGTSTSNCRTLAINLIMLANPGMSTSEISGGLITLVGINVISVVCLLLYFYQPLLFLFNTPFAIFKMLLIIVLSISGLVVLSKDYEGLKDFSDKHTSFNAVETVHAMIFVIYSYQGFINVNCVAGEIQEDTLKKNLKWAALISIVGITLAYMFITTVLYITLDYSSLTNAIGRDDAATVLASKVFGSTLGVRIAISLSGFGTLLYQIYTLARVKQAIAWRRIIPFYKFFGRQSPSFNSPGGALLLHALFTAIPLVALQNSSSDVRSFTTGIYSWSHQIIIALLALGLARLKQRMRFTHPNWEFAYLKQKWLLWGVSLLFTSTNVAIIVISALPPNSGSIPQWYWPIVTAVVIAAGSSYWGILRLLTVELGSSTFSIGRLIGFEPRIYDTSTARFSESATEIIDEANSGGACRYLTYKISGPTRSLYDGYHSVINLLFRFLGDKPYEKHDR